MLVYEVERCLPIRIRLVEHVDDVSFLEADAEFSTGHVGIVLRVVVDVSLDVHDRLFGCMAAAGRRLEWKQLINWSPAIQSYSGQT